jgi:hypothetical protein
MVTEKIKTPTLTLTTAHQRQQRGQHARDVPHSGGGGGDVSGGAGERDGNGRGGGDGSRWTMGRKYSITLERYVRKYSLLLLSAPIATCQSVTMGLLEVTL